MRNVAACAPFTIGLLVLVPASAVRADPPATNLILNGSFENGLTGWTAIAPSGFPPSVTNLRGATDGSFAVAFNSADRFGDQVLQQAFSTFAGGEFTLTFDY